MLSEVAFGMFPARYIVNINKNTYLLLTDNTCTIFHLPFPYVYPLNSFVLNHHSPSSIVLVHSPLQQISLIYNQANRHIPVYNAEFMIEVKAFNNSSNHNFRIVNCEMSATRRCDTIGE